MIYFARAGDTDLVKIGYAANVERRLAVLQAGNPLPLVLFRVLEGDRAVEGGFHRKYRSRRIAREWFSYCPTMETSLPLPRKSVRRAAQPESAAELIIGGLGGTSTVAKSLGLKLPAVSNWLHRGIPWRWRYQIAAMAKAKRVKLPADFLRAAA